MLRILMVLCLILAPTYGNNVTEAPDHSRRISNGVDTNIDEWPYQVSIRFYRRHQGSGTILKDNVVLTAAHMMQHGINVDYISIQYGLTTIGGIDNIITVRDYKCHPDYSGVTGANDVCLLYLKSPIPLSDNVKTVRLANEEIARGSLATVTGWGDYSDEGKISYTLKKAEVEVIDRDTCQKQATYVNITEEMICTSVGEDGKGICDGDSGGPLTVNGVQVGVASFGMGCGKPNSPSVYANVPKLHAWITENANNFVNVMSVEYTTMTTENSEN